MLLKDRTVIVTGGSRGIGAAIVSACLDAGANVLSADISAPGNFISGIDDSKHDRLRIVLGKDADVSSTSGRAYIVQKCIERFHTVDALVNNAGVNFNKPLLETTEEDFDRVINIDLRGAFFLTKEVFKQWNGFSNETRKTLSIVNISSVHASQGAPGQAPYDAAKAGMVGMSRALAVELAPLGVRVNVVSPGLVATAIWDELLEAAGPDRERTRNYWATQMPMARPLQPLEIASPVVFLLSDSSSGITGHDMLVDAGMTAMLLSTPSFSSRPIEGK
jgi:glucose 1-dehydrogenase